MDNTVYEQDTEESMEANPPRSMNFSTKETQNDIYAQASTF